MSRGLGSNATCIVAGLMGANYLTKSNLNKDEILKLATEKARSVLPKTITHKDGVFNVSRSALLVTAFMNNNLNLLKVACKDKFHQEYRSPLINNYDKIVNYSNNLICLGTFLSGAGPTIISLISNNDKDFLSKIFMKMILYLF